jgi:hypothetical protein
LLKSYIKKEYLIMTNLEYAKLLVNKFQLKKAETLNLYENEIKLKDILDPLETDVYLARVEECHMLANLAERMMQNLLNGSILPYDQID